MFSEKKIAFIHLLQKIVLFITYFESFLDNLDIKHEGVRQKRTPLMKLSLMHAELLWIHVHAEEWKLWEIYALAISDVFR